MDYLRRNKLMNGLVIVLVLFNLATLTMLWLGKDLPRPKGHPGGEKLLEEELGLNENQQRQITDLREQHFNSAEGLRRRSRDLRNQLHVLWKKEDSEKEAKKIAEQIGDLQEELEVEIFRHFSSIRKILDDGQKAKFDKIVTDVLRRGDRGPGGPPQDGPNGRRGQGPRGDRPPPDSHQ